VAVSDRLPGLIPHRQRHMSDLRELLRDRPGQPGLQRDRPPGVELQEPDLQAPDLRAPDLREPDLREPDLPGLGLPVVETECLPREPEPAALPGPEPVVRLSFHKKIESRWSQAALPE